jgi:predicted short-subunit dehydrogenase-like oxidoreductase (DUF2520 family)
MTEIDPRSLHLAIIGRGRLGTALTSALRDAGVPVDGPLGRAPALDPHVDVIVLAVPDAELAAAAAAVSPGPLVGHCSGATTLAPLAGHEAFSLHPLMTVTPDGADFQGATAAVAGSTDRALATATSLATAIGLRPVEVADADRAAYHAAASIAANFLVTLEAAAERLAETAGVDRAALRPLAQAALDNWTRAGGACALTGPIVRGDEATVTRQRNAVAERTPELLALFDVLAEATRDLARTGAPHATGATSGERRLSGVVG